MKFPLNPRWLAYLLALACIAMAPSGHAAVLAVTSTADTIAVDGHCTLREAITAVNTGASVNECVPVSGAFGTSDLIGFDIVPAGDPGCNGVTGVCTISPASALPKITRTVIIDGYTQPGAMPNTLAAIAYPGALGLDTQIKIEIDGAAISANTIGLWISAPGCWIKGLSIFNVPGNSDAIALNSNGNLVSGNFIGLRADGATAGTTPMAWGVYIHSNGNTVGGAAADRRNLIASNVLYDVEVYNGNSNVIAGNLIGSDITGTLARSPNSEGVAIIGSGIAASNNTITNNVIAGHGLGGVILDSATMTGVTGNAIGIGVGPGFAALGSNGSGIMISTSPASPVSLGNNISANAIANHPVFGILVLSSSAGDPISNRFDTNWIWGNGNLGINLNPVTNDLVTPNDALDADTGPNGLQNFPVIASVVNNGAAGFDIAFTLDSAVNTTYAISAYANDACDPSGYGEGQYPASGTPGYVTNGAGHLGSTLNVSAGTTGWATGKWVSMLATDSASNTSEFSQCVQIIGSAALPVLSINNVTANEGNSGATPFNFTVTLSAIPAVPVSVVWYTASGTAQPGTDYTGGNGTLTWAAGDNVLTRTVTVQVTGDTLVEPNEAFTVHLNTVGLIGATIGSGTGTGTILNDDVATAPAITSAAPPGSTAGTPYSFTVTANGSAPITFSATGLPANLAINPSTGAITGTPATAGSYSVTLTASNGTLPNATQAFMLNIAAAAAVQTSYTAPSATGTGSITASFSGGGAGCGYTTSRYIPLTGNAASPPSGTAPAGVLFPQGLFDFAASGCTPGSTITMTITYPQTIPSGTVYWKYGPTAGNNSPHWYTLPAAIAGNTATFSITDGGLGDDDLTANGTIVDQGGPGAGAGGGVAAIPTLSEWALLLLSLLVAGLGMFKSPLAPIFQRGGRS